MNPQLFPWNNTGRKSGEGGIMGANIDVSGSAPKTRAGMSPNRKLSVSEMMAMRDRGGPDMSIITDASTGQRLSNAEATARAPRGGYVVSGYQSGYGRGGYGGGPRPRHRISSAGVAGGTPTSAHGRAELAMQRNPNLTPEQIQAIADKPAWMASSDDWREHALDPIGQFGTPMGAYAEGTTDTGAKPKTAVVGEKGPEVVVLPPHSAVVPNSMLDDAWGTTAVDEVSGPQDGEIRMDSNGNPWRYDARQKRGIPMNPYLGGHSNAPSPDSFGMTGAQRYEDMSMRLDALRREGMAAAKARIAERNAEYAREQAGHDALIASGKPVATADGGGTSYETPYGRIIVGGTRPKSFTVENFEGGQTTTPNLAEAEKESRADAAERQVRGMSTRNYRGYGAPRRNPEQEQFNTAWDEIEAKIPLMPKRKA